MPKIRKARYVDRTELMELLAAFVTEQELKHGDIAEALGVSRAAISQALGDPKSSNDGLRVRIWRHLTDTPIDDERIWLVGGKSKEGDDG